MEEGFDYRVGADNVLKDWQSSNLTKEDCADLAASLLSPTSNTARGSHWTYKASEKRCWVKNTNNGKTPDPALVSGNKECGRAYPGETIFEILCLDLLSNFVSFGQFCIFLFMLRQIHQKIMVWVNPSPFLAIRGL